MLANVRIIVAAVGIVIAAGGLPGPAAADPWEALEARARGLAKAKTASAEERRGVILELARTPSAESASLVMSVGLGVTDPQTRSAARDALVTMCDEPRVRATVLAASQRAARSPGPLGAELALVLLAAAGDSRGSFRELLDQSPFPVAYRTWTGIFSVAVSPCDPVAIAALRTLATSRWFEASLACRRGLIATLGRMRDPAAIRLLVDLLEPLRGEARGDAVAYLSRISGERFGTDAAAWRGWLDANHDRLMLDEDAVSGSLTGGPSPPPPEPASQAEYYDIPIHAARVVFVLDTSSSMEGPPLEAAKRELESAIFSLPDETLFTVLFYNTGVGSWQRQLVPATEVNKRAAATFVSRRPAEGGTATSDALEAAFLFDTEAIFFLSDGAPSAGRIVEPAGIIQYVTRLNEGRAISLNTISVMGGASFLEALAEANLGVFRAVDR